MSIVKPFVGLPLISTMMSPARIPAAIGRRSGKRRHHDQRIAGAGLMNLDADSAEFLVDRLAEAGHFVRADIARIGIELGHHPFDRRLQQLPPIDILDIVTLNLVEGVDKDLHQGVVVVLLCLPVGRFRLGLIGSHDGRSCKNQDETQERRKPCRAAS